MKDLATLFPILGPAFVASGLTAGLLSLLAKSEHILSRSPKIVEKSVLSDLYVSRKFSEYSEHIFGLRLISIKRTIVCLASFFVLFLISWQFSDAPGSLQQAWWGMFADALLAGPNDEFFFQIWAFLVIGFCFSMLYSWICQRFVFSVRPNRAWLDVLGRMLLVYISWFVFLTIVFTAVAGALFGPFIWVESIAFWRYLIGLNPSFQDGGFVAGIGFSAVFFPICATAGLISVYYILLLYSLLITRALYFLIHEFVWDRDELNKNPTKVIISAVVVVNFALVLGMTLLGNLLA